VDPGTFIYNGAPEWRSHFRSTRAHNTVCVDGASQAEPDTTFSWKTSFYSRVVEHVDFADVEYIEAECVPHPRKASGLVHRRRLLHVKPEYWLLMDDFQGPGEHTLEFSYHFAPEVKVMQVDSDKEVLVANSVQAGLILGLFASQPIDREFVCGQMTPISGWASTQYGKKKPILSLRATMVASPPAAAMTFLIPEPAVPTNGSRRAVVRRMKLEYGGAIACSYEHRGIQHIAVFSTGDAEIKVADFCMQGHFFWLRMVGGVLDQVLAIRARSLSCDGRDIFRRSDPGPYYSAVNAGWEDSALCAQYAGS
jgi:hypothetical protein